VATTKRSAAETSDSASQLISQKIVELDDWRGDTLSRIRVLMKEADPDIVEEWKWGTPVWSHDGIVCTGETYKNAVKMTFPKGASLKDPARLFTSSLEGAVRRAVDIREGEKLNAPALKALIRAAVALNAAGKSKKAEPVKRAAPKAARKKAAPVKRAAPKAARKKAAPAKRTAAKSSHQKPPR
jgi:hypothetical protein